LGVVEVLGVERRRRWPDTVKLSILAEVNVNGWTLADVARRHDLTRQHIYQWRREMRSTPAVEAALL
jgi:transposase